MGCCVSTNNKPSSTSQKQQQQQHQHFHVGSAEPSKPNSTHESRAPPPDPEETVKEVLSETPKLKPPPSLPPPPPPPPQPTVKTLLQHDQKIHVQLPCFDEKTPGQNRDKNEEESMPSAKQDESEVCSLTLSLSESVSTTTITNDRGDYYYDDDDEGEMKQRMMMRSPSPNLVQRNMGFQGDLGPKRDRFVGKSPTRRSEQSPKKRNINTGGSGGGVRRVQSREPDVGRRAGLASDPNSRDSGESSGRRSRSPASNRSVIGRSPSTRRTYGSSCRVRKDPHENNGDGGGGNMKTEGGREPKWASNTNNGSTTSSFDEGNMVFKHDNGNHKNTRA